jgi:hypothetical protein
VEISEHAVESLIDEFYPDALSRLRVNQPLAVAIAVHHGKAGDVSRLGNGAINLLSPYLYQAVF